MVMLEDLEERAVELFREKIGALVEHDNERAARLEAEIQQILVQLL